VFHRSSFIVLCVSLLSACGEPASSIQGGVTFDPCQPLAVMPDATATVAQRQAIADGIALWNAAAGTRLSVGGGAPDPQATAPIPSLPLHYQSAAAPFHGLYDPPTGQVFINDDLDGHPREVTIAHEVGHSFGLLHVPGSERPSLMNPGNLVNEPTSADVATLAALWGGTCPPAMQ